MAHQISYFLHHTDGGSCQKGFSVSLLRKYSHIRKFQMHSLIRYWSLKPANQKAPTNRPTFATLPLYFTLLPSHHAPFLLHYYSPLRYPYFHCLNTDAVLIIRDYFPLLNSTLSHLVKGIPTFLVLLLSCPLHFPKSEQKHCKATLLTENNPFTIAMRLPCPIISQAFSGYSFIKQASLKSCGDHLSSWENWLAGQAVSDFAQSLPYQETQ